MGTGLPKHDEEDEETREKEVQVESLICAFETLGKAWPRSPETQRKSANGVQSRLSWLTVFLLEVERGRRERPGDRAEGVGMLLRRWRISLPAARKISEEAAPAAFAQNSPSLRKSFTVLNPLTKLFLVFENTQGA